MKYMDMHCDTVLELYSRKKEGKPYSLYENDCHIDIQKMIKGDCMLQNFAIFVHQTPGEDYLHNFLQYVDLYEELMAANTEHMAKVLTFDDIEKNRKAGKISAMLTMEEAAPLKGDLALLRTAYRMGVRMIALTWNYPNEIAYPNTMTTLTEDVPMTLKTGLKGALKAGTPDFYTPNTTLGLTDAGIAFVQEMERLGMIIDTSHLSDAGFYDVLKYTTKPFVASHSDTRALSPVIRNLTDDMIVKLAERGGVSGINFCAMFLDHLDPDGTIASAVEHVKHFIKVGGIDCVGLGGDLDGIRTHAELRDCSYYPQFADALVKAGLSEDEVEKVFYKNVLRVYKEVLK